MVAIEMRVNVWEVTRFETQNGRKMQGGMDEKAVDVLRQLPGVNAREARAEVSSREKT